MLHRYLNAVGSPYEPTENWSRCTCGRALFPKSSTMIRIWSWSELDCRFLGNWNIVSWIFWGLKPEARSPGGSMLASHRISSQSILIDFWLYYGTLHQNETNIELYFEPHIYSRRTDLIMIIQRYFQTLVIAYNYCEIVATFMFQASGYLQAALPIIDQ